jgi:hypothetical protein
MMPRDDDDLDWGAELNLDYFIDAYGDEFEEWDDMDWFDFLEANDFSEEAIDFYQEQAG